VGGGRARVGALRLEGLARSCACGGDDRTVGTAYAQRSGTGDACLERTI
jgi:hypothetical protein